jgi:hypothetical protein
MGSESLKALINMCQEPYVILYLGTLKTLSISFNLVLENLVYIAGSSTLQPSKWKFCFLQTSLAACMEMVLLPTSQEIIL